MNKIFNKKTVLICGLLPGLSTEEVTFEQYKAARGLYILDPWERVKAIFSKDTLGNRHPELLDAIQKFQLGAIVGLFFGGITEAVQKTEHFVHTNDANIYSNKKEAYKVLINENMLSFVRGGAKTAPTFAIFFGGFFLISSCCEAYRNKPEIVDSIVAGTVVGSLSRFMFGIKGMISGGIFGKGLRSFKIRDGDGKKGSLLGTIYGSTVWCLTKFSKTDQVELKYAQFAMSKYKNQFLDKPTADEESLAELFRLNSGRKENPLENQEKEDKTSKGTTES